MLTGEKPKGMFEMPSEIDNACPSFWDDILKRCLQPKPERRYNSCREVLSEVLRSAEKAGVVEQGRQKRRETEEKRRFEGKPAHRNHAVGKMLKDLGIADSAGAAAAGSGVEALRSEILRTLSQLNDLQKEEQDLKRQMEELRSPGGYLTKAIVMTLVTILLIAIAAAGRSGIPLIFSIISSIYTIRSYATYGSLTARLAELESKYDTVETARVEMLAVHENGIGGHTIQTEARRKKAEVEPSGRGGVMVVESPYERGSGATADREITNSVGIEFVYIESGRFMMGSPKMEKGRHTDERQHEVTLTRGYHLQKTVVTQSQWKAVMTAVPWEKWSFWALEKRPKLGVLEGDDYPAACISWINAQHFIERLNKKEGTNKYRLPTEAEWEYACRSGSSTAYYWGDRIDEDYLWYRGNTVSKVNPVGRKKPNAWGLYDMSGNVCEWCQDWYDGDYYDNSPGKDPRGPRSGKFRVLRGGSWDYNPRYCRSANRLRLNPVHTYYDDGFRIVRAPD